jgi:hypothetical protein
MHSFLVVDLKKTRFHAATSNGIEAAVGNRMPNRNNEASRKVREARCLSFLKIFRKLTPQPACNAFIPSLQQAFSWRIATSPACVVWVWVHPNSRFATRLARESIDLLIPASSSGGWLRARFLSQIKQKYLRIIPPEFRYPLVSRRDKVVQESPLAVQIRKHPLFFSSVSDMGEKQPRPWVFFKNRHIPVELQFGFSNFSPQHSSRRLMLLSL